MLVSSLFCNNFN